MGRSIDPMEVQNRDQRSPAIPAIVSMSLRPAIPWRVALQQSPPPLGRLSSMLKQVVESVNHHQIRGGEFSTGESGSFHPALTDRENSEAVKPANESTLGDHPWIEDRRSCCRRQFRESATPPSGLRSDHGSKLQNRCKGMPRLGPNAGHAIPGAGTKYIDEQPRI